MKQKLEELKKKRYTTQSELDTIDKEIKDLENQILSSDVRLYKGKWFYKSEDW
jgi:archaellum component FlaC